ncbi:methyl-accepting chemotaxis protein [Actinoplanes sp. CA-051413]|uniref:methyl-accepting chemotaxis protein n=1 Tax=Actinoplanes sp. CA-051413 TaxID=3239899 RepID=UPI003D961C5F
MKVGLRSVRISSRLVAAMVVLLALLIAVVAVGLSAIAGQSRATATLADYSTANQLAKQVKFRSADFNGWQTAYAFDIVRGVDGAAADTAEARAAFLASAASFRQELQALRGARITAAETELIDRVTQHFDEFSALDRTIVEAYRSSAATQVARANQLVAVDEIKIFNEIAANVDALTSSIDARSAAAMTDASAAADRSSVVMVAAGALTVLLGAVLAFVLIRSIIRPLGTLNHRLAEIADGDGDLTQRIHDDARDEIAEAAGGFNRFADRMQELVAAVAAGARQVSDAADELSTVSTQLAGGAEETSAQAGVVSASAEEVSTIVSTLAASAEEMNASIAEISRSASRASDIARGGVQATREADETVTRLGASSAEIRTVVKLITDIAAQTNLLALNATIEAARAGEVGKGFAVVAGEVKELAQQTASATEEIARKVEAISQGSGAAAAVIARISTVVTEINDTQLTIASAIEEQTATTQEMSRNVGETAVGAGEIATNIVGVAQAAEQASAGAQTTRTTARSLVDAAATLNGLVSTFRY